MQGENYFQLSASLKKPEELWIAKSDLIRLSLMTWIHLHIYPLYSNGDNVPCQQIFTTEWLSPVFLAMTMRFFAGLYVAANSSSHYRATSAIIICSITLSPSHGQPLSLSRSLAQGQAKGLHGRVGELSLWTVYFNLRSCRGQRTVVSCMPWQLFLNSLLVWCHDRIRGKCASNALMTHS